MSGSIAGGDHGQHFTAAISQFVWDSRYRFRDSGSDNESAADSTGDLTVEDTWWRVARALASVEPGGREQWAQRFYRNLAGFRFLPGGRILAGAGTGRDVTLFNCFVMGAIEDSIDSIFQRLRESALTLQQGGGIGCDFSTLRPRGWRARHTGTIASGPVSFMEVWDSMCATMLSTGSRRGAMMATLRCDHPDIEQFVDAKRNPAVLRHFNLSVLVSDAFMEAVAEDGDWPLVFPAAGLAETGGAVVGRRWSGETRPVPCRVLKTVGARDLWQRIMRATYDCAEPGVLFVDRINAANNLYYREQISTTNPCGEIPLPAGGACDLGSVNLLAFVRQPLTPAATLDWQGIADCAALGVRMLDNVIDLSRYPLPALEHQARGSRRIGLGITGLADALIALGLHYDSDAARELAARIMRLLRDTAYRASVELAGERGHFPFFDAAAYGRSHFVQALPQELQQAIGERYIRNSHLLAIAPTGTISLLANGVSSGVEPVFDFRHRRRVVTAPGDYREFDICDPVYRLWLDQHGEQAQCPPEFVAAQELSPMAHLAMEAALQPFVDNAISKTVNVPASYPFAEFESLYRQAFRLGLKGCTTYRPNAISGAVLGSARDAGAAGNPAGNSDGDDHAVGNSARCRRCDPGP